ncbi:MAG: PadR family transcriptional regulator [Solirubrobacteraceae bacterium]
MPASRLTPFSYAILGLVGRHGAGPHDIVRMMRQGRLYWTAATSQYYAEPKRLERLGFLTSRTTPGQTTDRTHYELTAAGRTALEAWLAEPTPLPKIQNEGTIRLLAGDLADDAELAASIAALRPQLDEMSGLIEQAEAAAASLPHRERYLRLNHALARDLIEALRRWTDRVEAELAPDGDGAADSAAPSGRQE